MTLSEFLELVSAVIGIGAVTGGILAWAVKMWVGRVVRDSMDSINRVVGDSLKQLTDGLSEQNRLTRESHQQIMGEMVAHDRRMAEILSKHATAHASDHAEIKAKVKTGD